MIGLEQKPFEEILESLGDEKKIFVIGCEECATSGNVGGEKQVQELVEKLKAAGKEITGAVVVNVPCAEAGVKRDLAKHRKALKETDGVVVLACGGGVQQAKVQGRISANVHPGCNTLFIGTMSGTGAFSEMCSACGVCILESTGGICPVTRCSKGLLNGPCGGAKDGKCEVDPEVECAWALIYDNLKKQGRLDLLKKFHPAKDYRKAIAPRRRAADATVASKESK